MQIFPMFDFKSINFFLHFAKLYSLQPTAKSFISINKIIDSVPP